MVECHCLGSGGVRLASAEMSLGLILAVSQWRKEKEEERDAGREGGIVDFIFFSTE